MKTPIDNHHIIPKNDLKKHIEKDDCWCNPDILDTYEDGLPPYRVVHNPVDTRKKKYVFIDIC